MQTHLCIDNSLSSLTLLSSVGEGSPSSENLYLAFRYMREGQRTLLLSLIGL